MTLDPDGFTIHGPCPGCDNWTLEVPNADAVAAAWIVELIIREHAAECPGLAVMARARGVDIQPHNERTDT